MAAIRQDVRYAVRRLTRSPLFTLIAVVSLALGIGANTALFSVVNAVLLRGPAVTASHELVEIYTSDDGGFQYATSSYPDLRDLREQNSVFTGVTSSEVFFGQVDLDGTGRLVLGEVVSGNYFDLLGVRPLLGRSFVPEEDETPLTHAVALISETFWETAYGSDPGVLDRDVRLNGQLYQIVGVVPEDFKGTFPGLAAELWVPSMMVGRASPRASDPHERRGNRSIFLKGRLRPGVTVEQADAEVRLISERLETEYPNTNEDRIMSAVPTDDVAINPVVDRALIPVAGLLLSVVGIVLLVACANLASFLLARAADRKREIAIRLAMGAGRGQLVRQLLIESTLLAGLGGAGALALAHWTLALLVRFQPPVPIPIQLDFGIDARVFVFTVIVSLVAGFAFGLLPALQATKPDLVPSLKEGGDTGRSRRRRFLGRWTLRDGLVVVQVAFSLVLLIGAGLFVRSLTAAQHVNPGFDTGPGAIIWPDLQLSGIPQDEWPAVREALSARFAELPGVESVAMGDRLPLGLGVRSNGFEIPDSPVVPAGETTDIDVFGIDEHYLSTMGVSVVQGRNFGPEDGAEGLASVLVNEAAARRYWPGIDPIGMTVRNGQTPQTIVGVVRDFKIRTLGEEPRPAVFYPARDQVTDPAMLYLIRGDVESASLVASARDAALELYPNLVLFEAKTMTEHLSVFLFPPRMAALLLSVLGGLALVLASVGLFGLISYSVSRRRREMGIRMSLGATLGTLTTMVVSDGLKLALVGTGFGLLIAALASRFLEYYLIGVGSGDPLTFVLVPMILIGVALLAAVIPARRIARVDPVGSLRSD